ncbi:MAG: RluA family pseudouridine synthase [Syntrophomonadaceae bacterium]|nr:RluA family pseudouridine synthase [Syntrophomonadaceae bacterium]
MLRSEKFLITQEAEGERLDIFLADKMEGMSRSTIKSLIDDDMVKVDGVNKRPSYRLKSGEEVLALIPQVRQIELEPQDIALEIIYQDNHIAIINKPVGMVVHPAHGNWDNTLVNALLYHIKDLSGINGELRPGIVHRLDKDTSGVMVVAKTDQALRSLSNQIKEHSINREYTALVHGIIKENLGTIDAPIGRSKTDRKKMAVVNNGRQAISNYQVLERFNQYTLIKVKLLTGRTHQIRVHFAYLHHPIVGDPLYGPAKKHLGMRSQVLHASLLGLVHPETGEYMEFTSELPEYFSCILKDLRKNN